MEFLRKHLNLILRVVVSGVVLGFLAHKMDWAEFINDIRNARGLWLLAGFFLIGLTMVIGTYRWKLLLKVQGIDLPYMKLYPMNMIGQFFNAFLLGVTGGDVMKIFYVTQACPDKRSAAGLSVIYDRILGLMGIMFWGLILSINGYSFLTSTPATHTYVWLFYVICMAALGGILFALMIPWLRRNSGLWKLEQKLPFHQTLENLSDAFQRYARSPMENLLVLGLSIFIHCCIFVTMFAVAHAIRMEVNFWQLASIVSIVSVLIAVPLSISGLGIRETLFATFLGLIAIPHTQAYAFSLLGFGLNILWSLVGAFYFMRHKKHDQAVGNPVTV